MLIHGIRFQKHRKAVTLTELLVATAISLIFMTSITMAYIQISRAADVSERRVKSHAKTRTGIDAIIRDVRQLQTDPSLGLDQYFVIQNNTLAYGDFIDNDGDGLTDEELPDGFDTDGDWVLTDDNHATIGSFTEREAYQGVPDLGDFNVDEDVRFSNDLFSFRIPANAVSLEPAQNIIYQLGTFDGEDNVLLRTVISDPGGAAVITTEPVMFDVLSFNVLAMNANNTVISPATPQQPYWQENYDANDFTINFEYPVNAFAPVPPFEFPSALYISITVNASGQSIEELNYPANGNPIETYTLSSVVAIEETIDDFFYTLFIRP